MKLKSAQLQYETLGDPLRSYIKKFNEMHFYIFTFLVMISAGNGDNNGNGARQMDAQRVNTRSALALHNCISGMIQFCLSAPLHLEKALHQSLF